MIENEYVLVWAAYAVAALGCLLVWCRLTSWMWRYLREPLRVIVAVLLFAPTIVDPGRELFAPAIAVTALDLLFKVVPLDNILFGSEMVGAVRGVDPETGFNFDDTKRYVDALNLTDEQRTQVYEGNVRKVFARFKG